MPINSKRKLSRQSQFPNITAWENYLKENISDGDIVTTNLDDEHQGEDCHYRGVNGLKFDVQAEWDDWYQVDAKDIISFDLAG